MSQMKALADSPRGRRAKSQEDLVRIAQNRSAFKEEDIEHPLCENGFRLKRADGGLDRMTEEDFREAVMSLLRSRPSAHAWDVKPDYEVQKIPIFVQSPDMFKTSFLDKSTLLSDEFARRPGMEGFSLELHDVIVPLGLTTPQKAPSMSLYIYESEYALEDLACPVKIHVRYRTNF